MKAVKLTLKILICAIVILILIVAAYVIYVMVNYERIEDNTKTDVEFQQNPLTSATLGVQDGAALEVGNEYKALSFNIGFGAYDHEFSFFMDEGYLADGTPVTGTMSRGRSKEAVEINTNTVIEQSLAEDADIMLFQEVDVDADRSYQINQRQAILNAYFTKIFEDGTDKPHNENFYYWTYAQNFHTPYLFYPPTKPIGFIRDSGILTVSRYVIESSVRRSFPVSDAFPTKFFDLDRCFSVNRMPVRRDGVQCGYLVLINAHMSAYDEGGTIRRAQMELISDVITREYADGNWVILGGDFNHAIGGSETQFMNSMGTPPWVQKFDDAFVPDGFSLVIAENIKEVATARDTSLTYEKGFNYETVLDGFIVSDNVKAVAHNIDADYVGSDHNPVLLSFTLEE